MTTVALPCALSSLADGQNEIDAEGATVREVIGSLDRRFPGMAERLIDERGNLRSYVSILVGEADARRLGGLDAPVGESDRVTILPAIAGGAGGRLLRRAPRGGAFARMPARLLRALAREAERAWPAEACGLVFGRGAPSRIVPVQNAAGASRWRAFVMEPVEVLLALKQAEERGERLLGIYHSHAEGGPELSQADERAALGPEGEPLWPGVEWLVIALRDGAASAAASYRWKAGRFVGRRLRVRPSVSGAAGAACREDPRCRARRGSAAAAAA